MGDGSSQTERANAALVRRAFEAWNRSDWATLEDVYAPDVVAVAPDGFPESGERRGWPALREEYERLKATWREESIEEIELIAAGDQVAARVRWAGVGKASGAPSSVEVSNLVTVRDGKITQLEYYWSLEEARAAMKSRSR